MAVTHLSTFLEAAECYRLLPHNKRPLIALQVLAAADRIKQLEDDSPLTWISIKDEWPPRHKDVWCLNKNGIQFVGRICVGMHKPFMTFPHGWDNASDTAPSWVDVTHWRYAIPHVPEDS